MAQQQACDCLWRQIPAKQNPSCVGEDEADQRVQHQGQSTVGASMEKQRDAWNCSSTDPLMVPSCFQYSKCLQYHPTTSMWCEKLIRIAVSMTTVHRGFLSDRPQYKQMGWTEIAFWWSLDPTICAVRRCTVDCWRRSVSARDTTSLNKLIHEAGEILWQKLELSESVRVTETNSNFLYPILSMTHSMAHSTTHSPSSTVVKTTLLYVKPLCHKWTHQYTSHLYAMSAWESMHRSIYPSIQDELTESKVTHLTRYAEDH